MNVQKYGRDIKVNRELLTASNVHVVSGFNCELDDLNFLEYLADEAIYDNEARTYVYIDQNGKASAFASLSCTVLMQVDNKENKSSTKYYPAILIDKFIVDSSLRHLRYSPEEERTFSEIVFMDVLEYIEELAMNYIGAKYVVLYSTPKAKHFYEKCEDVNDFTEYMAGVNDPYLEDCHPMYAII